MTRIDAIGIGYLVWAGLVIFWPPRWLARRALRWDQRRLGGK